MKKLIAVVTCATLSIFDGAVAYAAADKAMDLFANPTANQRLSPDYYVGGDIGTGFNATINQRAIDIPLVGSAKAGVYFNKYMGIEVSALFAPMGGTNDNSSSRSTSGTSTTSTSQPSSVTTYVVNKVGGNSDFVYCGASECNGTVTTHTKTTVTTTTTSDINEHNVNNREWFGVTKTVTTLPVMTTTSTNRTIVQQASNQQNQSLNAEMANLMLRMPFTYVSLFGGVGPAVLNTPGTSEPAISEQAGFEIPFGMIGWSNQIIFVQSQGAQVQAVLSGISIHF